ncbi:DUF3352 domain-containing protein [Desulfovibrio aminophilus]|nr:DUF3352 domain-containing protein [Desulfovibrio aminophilus]
MLSLIIVAVVSALAGFAAAWVWRGRLRKKIGGALTDAAARVREG